MWLVVHVFFLIGFRSRLGVLGQWAWTYITFNDGVRLITGSQDLPGWEDANGGHTGAPIIEPVAEEVTRQP
jgi:NADH dehydrogenase